MTKAFTEVLPALKLPENLAAIADRIQVTNVVMPRTREHIDIHAYTDEIVAKRDINALQAHIKNQFFATRDLTEVILPALNITPTIVHLAGTE